MKSSLIPYRYSSLLFLVLFYAGNVLANECRNYSFLNKKDNLTGIVTINKLKGDKDFKLEADLGPNTVDVTLTNLAIWVDPNNAGKWKKEIDKANNSQKKALAKLKNTAERLALEFEQVEGDIRRYFENLEQAIQEAGEDDLTAKPVLAHWRSRDRDQERTAHDLLEGLFARHWREHLGQLGELRESLGI